MGMDMITHGFWMSRFQAWQAASMMASYLSNMRFDRYACPVWPLARVLHAGGGLDQHGRDEIEIGFAQPCR